jgi:hypothetical protein
MYRHLTSFNSADLFSFILDLIAHLYDIQMRSVKSGLSSIAANVRHGNNGSIHEIRLMLPVAPTHITSSIASFDSPLVVAARAAFTNVFGG